MNVSTYLYALSALVYVLTLVRFLKVEGLVLGSIALIAAVHYS